MGQVQKLDRRPSKTILPPPAGEEENFRRKLYWAALLPAGSIVYRYGSSRPQLESTQRQWLYVTEDAFEYSEDALQICSLLDMTALDHGERDVASGVPLGGVTAIQAWNTAALRGRLHVSDNLLVWAGKAAPLSFDRKKGIAVGSGKGGTIHSSTVGGASQILVKRADVPKLELMEVAVLRRVRYYH